jgi:hypothetical protein
MKWLGIFLVVLSLSAYSAGLANLFRDNKTPAPAAPKPETPKPQPPKPLSTPVLAPKPAPQPATAPNPAAPAPQKSITNSNNPTTDTKRPCSPTDSTCKR